MTSPAADGRIRDTHEVLEDHLALTQAGDIETDLLRNFAEDCVILTSVGVFRGHDGCRRAVRQLDEQVGTTHFSYDSKMWHGELAFLEWSADGPKARIDDGTDSYWVKDGRIQAMTIHYTVHSRRAH